VPRISQPAAIAPGVACVSDPAARVTRILTIAPTPFFGDRGCHVRIYEEVRGLAGLGIESLVATYAVGNEVPGVRTRRSVSLPGIRPSALGPSWTRPLLDVTLLGTVLRAVREFKPQLLHAHLHEGVLLATVARALTGLPVVADLQGSLTEELIDHGFLPRAGITTRGMRGLEGWLARRPDVLLVSSAAASGLVASAHVDHDRVIALPDGADLQTFAPVSRDPQLVERFGLQGKRVVVFLGVLTPYQGVDVLLEAIPHVLATVTNAHFLLMGYPNEERYRAIAAARGLGHRVTFTGRTPYRDAARWLALGDVAVSPKQSLSEANGKLLNYMACALPTVATDTPVNRELLGPDGEYAPVGDAAALARALITLMEASPDARARIGAVLRARVEREFSWPVLSRRLAAVYEQVASSRSLAHRAA
jgi:glycosyltransferase involved in cell wall biosynthesis